MPLFTVTDTFGDPVSVQAGDIIQNTGVHMIFVCPVSPATDGDSVEVPINKGVTIESAATIRVRSIGRRGGSFKLIRGL